MPYLAMVRHGLSAWNQENRFTGWVDVDLAQAGIEQAQQAGDLLRAEAIEFDHAFTSVLRRAIRTLWIALDRMGLPNLRNKATVEALIPFTNVIPTFTVCWFAARLLNLGDPVQPPLYDQYGRPHRRLLRADRPRLADGETRRR